MNKYTYEGNNDIAKAFTNVANEMAEFNNTLQLVVNLVIAEKNASDKRRAERGEDAYEVESRRKNVTNKRKLDVNKKGTVWIAKQDIGDDVKDGDKLTVEMVDVISDKYDVVYVFKSSKSKTVKLSERPVTSLIEKDLLVPEAE